MTQLTPLTNEYIKRAKQAIAQHTTLLNNELRYPLDLQKPELIASYRKQIEKIENMIVNGWNAPKFN